MRTHDKLEFINGYKKITTGGEGWTMIFFEKSCDICSQEFTTSSENDTTCPWCMDALFQGEV